MSDGDQTRPDPSLANGRNADAGEAFDVQRIHEHAMRAHHREMDEPRDGFEPVPFWVAAVCGALLMWGGYYVGSNSADFRPDVYDSSELRSGTAVAAAGPVVEPDPQTVADLSKIGAQVYQNVCQACHQPHGNGGQGIPPLNKSEWVAGAEASPARLSRILLYGLTGPVTVGGTVYNGQMPAQGGVLKDYQIAGVLTYVRNNWENTADPDNAKPAITAAVVKATRSQEGARPTSGAAAYTEPLLKAIPVDATDTGGKK